MAKPVRGNSLVGTSGDDILDTIIGKSADYTVDGGAGNDVIYGGNGRDKLYGGLGNDLIYGAANDALIDGGGGQDTASFLHSSTGVRVELWDGGMGSWGVASPTYRSKVIKVENVDGSDFADHLGGSRAVNRLDGGGGDDQLMPMGSGDFLTGGAGADRFYAGAASGNVTITDFNSGEGDRIRMDGSPVFAWDDGFAPDADGIMHQAWIGTCNTLSGGTFQLIVLGSATGPSTDWFG